MNSKMPSITVLSIVAFAVISCQPSLENAIQLLKYGDRDQRVRAAESLGKIKDIRSVELLIAALNDEDFAVSSTAQQALVRLGHLAVEPLIVSLRERGRAKIHHEDLYDAVSYILQNIGAPAVDPLIVALQDDNNALVKELAAEVLGRLIINTRAVEPLIVALKDNNQEVRESAAHALGSIRDTRAVEPLIANLSNETEAVYSAAIRALQNLNDRRAVEPLIALLNNNPSYSREYAAEALGYLGDVRAVDPIVA